MEGLLSPLVLAVQVRDQQLADGLSRFRRAEAERALATAERHHQELQRLTVAQAEGQEALRRAAQSVQDRVVMERLGGTWSGTSGLAIVINQLETDDFDGRFGSDIGRWSLRDGKLCFQRKGSSSIAKYQYDLAEDGKTLTLRQLEIKTPKGRSGTITLRR